MSTHNPFVAGEGDRPQTVPTPPLSPDPILGEHFEAHGAPAPTGAPQPAPPWIGIWDTRGFSAEAPGLFWLATHGGCGATTLRTIAAQRGLPSIVAQQWPRLPHGRAAVILAARTHAWGLHQALRAAQEWSSGMVDHVVDLRGLILLADAPGGPARELEDQITALSALVPSTWTISWQPKWRAVLPREPHPLDTRTKLVLGRIKRDLSRTTDRKSTPSENTLGKGTTNDVAGADSTVAAGHS
ncbi:DUF6668 family protein [Enemella evansiae]|uniref:DUF6668 family protein n=1 Tax=Enemella evansiae TaxID=2016499 RepID=UPI0011405C23|nr:DUF6668 family protein [Enemella evansiae]